MSKTMRGLVNFAPEPHSVEFRDVPIPAVEDDDVLVRVEAVGVCGSDLHQYHGKQSWPVQYPVVLGHEFSGVIVEAGQAVTGFELGDRVVSETAARLNLNSPFYKSGQYNLDPSRLGFGYGVNGAMTEFVKVPQRCLHRIPPGLSFELAALAEPCAVAFNAVCVSSNIRPGDMVAVLGPGPIGLLCLTMAKLAGANPLIAVGTQSDRDRLRTAIRLGANHGWGAEGEDVLTALRGMGDGFGADLVIDAAGVSATLLLGMKMVRPGGQITKVGWGPQPCGFSLDMLVQKAVTLRGSFSHNWPMWERVLAMMASNQLDLDGILSRVAPLTDWQACFDQMHRGEIVKAVLRPFA